MEIIHNASSFLIFKTDTILDALNKSNSNKGRSVFVVSEEGLLEGVLTDGDLRRWLTSTQDIDFTLSVSSIMNKDFVFASIEEEKTVLNDLLDTKIKALPLVDSKKRLVAVAVNSFNEYEIEGRLINKDSSSFIIAEIGNNHNGSLEFARELVDEAILSGADCVKFQMRDMGELYGDSLSGDMGNVDLGTQYTLELLKKFQLSDEELFEIFDYVRAKGSIPLCTPWDIKSLNKLENYNLAAYKVASADFTNFKLIEAIANTGKLMICSTGMATEKEIRQGIKFIKKLGCPHVLLHCNSTYPAPFKDINLSYIAHLAKLSKGLVGYSGHERDINISIAAVALGAKVIEKHFTLDKSMEGNDHKVSLLPDEFKRMVEGIRQVEESLQTSLERTISQGEMMNRENLAKSLVAKVEIPAGQEITEDMIDIRSPGQGLQPSRITDLVGRKLQNLKKKGDFFFENDLNNNLALPGEYKFPRKWGIPVRYHDLEHMRQMSNMDLVEIHLSYSDMQMNFKEFIPKALDLDLVIHAPELFKGDHTLDLCSLDDDYRNNSIEYLQETIDLTLELKKYFRNKEDILIVTNVGGFSDKNHLDESKHEELYSLLEDSLTKLQTEGVEIIPQTMPPFPWHFGGQQFHNLFVDADSIVKFCKKNNMRICFDASHSKLACNYNKHSFTEFTQSIGPFVAHMHIADASGVDGEGLQIDQGDIDWNSFIKVINQHSPKASFIPEIWQGHKNNGEGAWEALNKLMEFSISSK